VLLLQCAIGRVFLQDFHGQAQLFAAGLLVSFLEGMVLRSLGQALEPDPCGFHAGVQSCGCIFVLLQYFAIGRIFMLVFDGQAWLFLTHHMLGLVVSVPEGRVSCRYDHVLGSGLGNGD